jgi:RNA chaperone Hfq
VTDLGEKYLVAAMAAAVSVSVHFQDGEVLDGRIVHVGTYTIMIESEDNERTLVYKNAVKKIGKSRISS